MKCFEYHHVVLLIAAALGIANSNLPNANAIDDWPAFRGPDGDGVVRGAINLPSEWSASSNIAWRTELPGEGWSSPVISDGKIYVTAAIPDDGQEGTQKDYSLSLLTIDASTGERLDTIEVMRQEAATTPKTHAKNSHASPTPIIRGDRLYVHFGYQGTACLNLEGDVLWVNRDLYFKPTHGNGGTPVLVGDHLVFTCDGDNDPKVVALDATSGKIVWQTRRPIKAKKTFSFCTPTVITVNGQTQLIAPGSDHVLALDPETGEVIWDVRYEGYSVVPKPVFDRGLVYVATSFDSSKLLAIDPTGRGVVTDTHVKWQIDKNMPKTPSLIAYDGLVYSISDDGIAVCIDGLTGDVQFRERIGGNFSASPLFAGNRIYVTSEEGVTTVFQAGREFKEIAKNEIGERTLASPAVTENALIMRTKDAIYRIESR